MSLDKSLDMSSDLRPSVKASLDAQRRAVRLQQPGLVFFYDVVYSSLELHYFYFVVDLS